MRAGRDELRGLGSPNVEGNGAGDVGAHVWNDLAGESIQSPFFGLVGYGTGTGSALGADRPEMVDGQHASGDAIGKLVDLLANIAEEGKASPSAD